MEIEIKEWQVKYFIQFYEHMAGVCLQRMEDAKREYDIIQRQLYILKKTPYKGFPDFNNFNNITEVFDYFKNNEVCIKHLEQKRWAGTPACNHCGSINVWRTNRGFKCGEKECGKKFTVTTGTIYENTKLPLRTWFAAIYLHTPPRKVTNVSHFAKQMQITQKTAWFLNRKIREILNSPGMPHASAGRK